MIYCLQIRPNKGLIAKFLQDKDLAGCLRVFLPPFLFFGFFIYYFYSSWLRVTTTPSIISFEMMGLGGLGA